MSDNSKALAKDNLYLFADILDSFNVPFVLDGGTCLGAYRDKDFCADDESDVDLTTFDTYSYFIPQIIKAAIEKGFDWHYHYNLGNKSTQQIALRRNGLKIDLMFKKIKDEWAWWTVYKQKKFLTYKKVPKYFYENTQTIEFLNRQFKIPLEIESYLTYRYSTWNIPVHRTEYSCYTSDKCIVSDPEQILELIGKYETGITFGAFEKFHYGHRNLFINIKKKCKQLIVCVSDDDYIRNYKNHEPVTSLVERIEKIKECPEVDIFDIQSIINNKKSLVEKYNPDIIFVGNDWNPKTFQGANLGVPVIYLPRTENISSTLLRKHDEETKVDYSSDLTIFVITSGLAPNLPSVMEALNNQTCKFKIDVIKDYSPMSAAFQQMLDRCTTKYFIQCDNDMVLYPKSVQTMYEYIKKSSDKTAIASFKLFDPHLGYRISGIKIYNNDIVKNYPYNLNCLSCEVEQSTRLINDKYNFITTNQLVGTHNLYWTERDIFDRYYKIMQKYHVYKYSFSKRIPQIVFNKFKTEPTLINFYACLGIIAGILNTNPRQEEKNFNKPYEEFVTLKEWFPVTEEKNIPVENFSNNFKYAVMPYDNIHIYPNLKGTDVLKFKHYLNYFSENNFVLNFNHDSNSCQTFYEWTVYNTKSYDKCIATLKSQAPHFLFTWNCENYRFEWFVKAKKELNIPLIAMPVSTGNLKIEWLKECDYILPISEAIGNILKENGMTNYTVIPIGIDSNKFFVKDVPKDNNEFIILSIGRGAESKNWQIAYESIKILAKKIKTKVRWIVIGNNKFSNCELDNLIIESHKVIPQPELIDFYNKADTYFLPTLYEGQGLCFIESMMCGTPVVTSNIAPMTEFIKKGYNGELGNPYSSINMFRKLYKIYKKSKQHYTKKCIEEAKNFEINVINEKRKNVWLSAIRPILLKYHAPKQETVISKNSTIFNIYNIIIQELKNRNISFCLMSRTCYDAIYYGQFEKSDNNIYLGADISTLDKTEILERIKESNIKVHFFPLPQSTKPWKKWYHDTCVPSPVMPYLTNLFGKLDKPI